MDLRSPCSLCTSIHRKPAFYRHSPSPNATNYPLGPFKCRRKTTSELRTPVEAASSYSPLVPSHKVTVHDRQRGVVHEFLVPEDQYILHTAEAQDIALPFACRHGCCTSCAVRIKSGELRQPEALGISAELKAKACINFLFGYALLCVGFPSSDIEVETQDEDEVICITASVYLSHKTSYHERDDYALELAMADE
ncbi:hypothetical protein RJ639_000740 [Escallonia herrerae]|uniref:2Fe-2S ferredoxin-type domain-containing protein n=1 Tax=Escallonia herrerae TaxID=1293975 RepID=A0AA88X8N1_9ASTE|nr:hypothetical protein RJ639_000740 [Escallonia herrerae]